MNNFVNEIIQNRRKEPSAVLESKQDLLSRYLCMEGENGQGFSDKYLRDILH